MVQSLLSCAGYHQDQFSVISTSADGGKTWKEVFAYDQGRDVKRQHTIFLSMIFLSKITEEDILAGKLVHGESFLNTVVSCLSDQGGERCEGDKL
jgi:hypothetical protein